MKRALITGVTGQDGSFLAQFLLEKGYEVFGLVRRSSMQPSNFERLEKLGVKDKITLIDGDLLDQSSLNIAVKETEPDEVYNLAAQSFVSYSWKNPVYTADTSGLGVLRILEAIRNYDTGIKFYQASSSEMFGKGEKLPFNEHTRFYPRSPYGVAKIFGYYTTINYRESYNMFAVNGILFNHESEMRGVEFVTRKITQGVAKIHLGLKNHISLGNLDAKRDWGYAPDFVRAMWLMLNREIPDDYVICTGESHSVREFVEKAFEVVGIRNWERYVKKDMRFMRPAEVPNLRGDFSKAKELLGWEPKVKFNELVRIMVENDLKLLEER